MGLTTWLGGHLAAFAVIVFALAVFGLAYRTAVLPSRRSPKLGVRGYERQLAVAKGGVFATFEPLLRWLGYRIGKLVPDRLWNALDRRLVRAGDVHGITPEEYVVLVAVGVLFGGSVGSLYGSEYGLAAPIVGGALGAYAVQSTFDARIQQRATEITHGLPYVTDLLALSMSAGLDFVGAVTAVVERASNRRDAMVVELERILRELGLGHTRKSALMGFAERSQLEPVSEFVAAIVQAEEHGTPLAQVLAILAMVARQKRAALAEVQTGRATTFITVPVLMAYVAAAILVVAPALLRIVKTFESM